MSRNPQASACNTSKSGSSEPGGQVSRKMSRLNSQQVQLGHSDADSVVSNAFSSHELSVGTSFSALLHGDLDSDASSQANLQLQIGSDSTTSGVLTTPGDSDAREGDSERGGRSKDRSAQGGRRPVALASVSGARKPIAASWRASGTSSRKRSNREEPLQRRPTAVRAIAPKPANFDAAASRHTSVSAPASESRGSVSNASASSGNGAYKTILPLTSSQSAVSKSAQSQPVQVALPFPLSAGCVQLVTLPATAVLNGVSALPVPLPTLSVPVGVSVQSSGSPKTRVDEDEPCASSALRDSIMSTIDTYLQKYCAQVDETAAETDRRFAEFRFKRAKRSRRKIAIATRMPRSEAAGETFLAGSNTAAEAQVPETSSAAKASPVSQHSAEDHGTNDSDVAPKRRRGRPRKRKSAVSAGADADDDAKTDQTGDILARATSFLEGTSDTGVSTGDLLAEVTQSVFGNTLPLPDGNRKRKGKKSKPCETKASVCETQESSEPQQVSSTTVTTKTCITNTYSNVNQSVSDCKTGDSSSSANTVGLNDSFKLPKAKSLAKKHNQIESPPASTSSKAVPISTPQPSVEKLNVVEDAVPKFTDLQLFGEVGKVSGPPDARPQSHKSRVQLEKCAWLKYANTESNEREVADRVKNSGKQKKNGATVATACVVRDTKRKRGRPRKKEKEKETSGKKTKALRKAKVGRKTPAMHHVLRLSDSESDSEDTLSSLSLSEGEIRSDSDCKQSPATPARSLKVTLPLNSNRLQSGSQNEPTGYFKSAAELAKERRARAASAKVSADTNLKSSSKPLKRRSVDSDSSVKKRKSSQNSVTKLIVSDESEPRRLESAFTLAEEPVSVATRRKRGRPPKQRILRKSATMAQLPSVIQFDPHDLPDVLRAVESLKTAPPDRRTKLRRSASQKKPKKSQSSTPVLLSRHSSVSSLASKDNDSGKEQQSDEKQPQNDKYDAEVSPATCASVVAEHDTMPVSPVSPFGKPAPVRSAHTQHESASEAEAEAEAEVEDVPTVRSNELNDSVNNQKPQDNPQDNPLLLQTEFLPSEQTQYPSASSLCHTQSCRSPYSVAPASAGQAQQSQSAFVSSYETLTAAHSNSNQSNNPNVSTYYPTSSNTYVTSPPNVNAPLSHEMTQSSVSPNSNSLINNTNTLTYPYSSTASYPSWTAVSTVGPTSTAAQFNNSDSNPSTPQHKTAVHPDLHSQSYSQMDQFNRSAHTHSAKQEVHPANNPNVNVSYAQAAANGNASALASSLLDPRSRYLQQLHALNTVATSKALQSVGLPQATSVQAATMWPPGSRPPLPPAPSNTHAQHDPSMSDYYAVNAALAHNPLLAAYPNARYPSSSNPQNAPWTPSHGNQAYAASQSQHINAQNTHKQYDHNAFQSANYGPQNPLATPSRSYPQTAAPTELLSQLSQLSQIMQNATSSRMPIGIGLPNAAKQVPTQSNSPSGLMLTNWFDLAATSQSQSLQTASAQQSAQLANRPTASRARNAPGQQYYNTIPATSFANGSNTSASPQTAPAAAVFAAQSVMYPSAAARYFEMLQQRSAANSYSDLSAMNVNMNLNPAAALMSAASNMLQQRTSSQTQRSTQQGRPGNGHPTNFF